MVASTFRSGSCLCRGVTFRVSGEPLRVGICHCADCRKASGSTFSAFAVWPLEAFEQQTGYTNSYGGRSFCTTCGSHVASLRDDEAEVMIGSLDDAPTDLAPQYELWIGRREHWLNALPGVAQFDKDRIVSENGEPPGPPGAGEPVPVPGRENPIEEPEPDRQADGEPSPGPNENKEPPLQGS